MNLSLFWTVNVVFQKRHILFIFSLRLLLQSHLFNVIVYVNLQCFIDLIILYFTDLMMKFNFTVCDQFM